MRIFNAPTISLTVIPCFLLSSWPSFDYQLKYSFLALPFPHVPTVQKSFKYVYALICGLLGHFAAFVIAPINPDLLTNQ